MTRTVEYYETSEGKIPFREWVDSLRDIKARAKIRVRIDRVALGNLGQCDPVGSGVHEMKIDYGPGYRVYFAQSGSTMVILLCGGDKSTQSKDIKKAQGYWADYRRQHHG